VTCTYIAAILMHECLFIFRLLQVFCIFLHQGQYDCVGISFLFVCLYIFVFFRIFLVIISLVTGHWQRQQRLIFEITYNVWRVTSNTAPSLTGLPCQPPNSVLLSKKLLIQYTIHAQSQCCNNLLVLTASHFTDLIKLWNSKMLNTHMGKW